MALRSAGRPTLWGVLLGTSLAAALAAACTGGSGNQGSFVGSNDPSGAVPTTVAGKSDTSGISAGSALQPPGATPTRAP